MKFGSLFAGIGGFDLGFERAGFQSVWQSEIDPSCLKVLNEHWPQTERFGDVAKLGGAELQAVDLVAGGFPCQDVSVAGQRAGLAGDRSGLWFEFHRLLAEHRPAWVVVENVPGLLSSQGGRDLALILRGLAELGYGAAYRILDVQHFRIPQRRRRVFIVGHLGDYRAVEVLLESEGLQGNPAQGREERPRIAEGTLSRALSRVGGGDDPGANKGAALIVTDARGNGRGDLVSSLVGDHSNRVTDYTPIIVAPLRSSSHPNSNEPGRGGEDDQNLVIGPLGGGNDGIGRRDEDDPNLIYGMIPGNSADSYGIGLEEGISPPVRGGGAGAKPTIAFAQNTRDEVRLIAGNGNSVGAIAAQPGMKQQTFLAGVGVRRLTPTECERLQGFPDGWTAGHSDTARYRMLGNAVCVPVAEWIGRRILQFSD